MIALTYLLLTGASGIFVAASTIVVHDVFVLARAPRHMAQNIAGLAPPKFLRWRTTAALLIVAWVPLLLGLTMVGH